MIASPASSEPSTPGAKPLLHQNVLLALNTGDVVPDEVLKWQLDLAEALMTLGANVDVAHSGGSGLDMVASAFAAIDIKITTQTKYLSERSGSGWLPPRYHAGDIVRQVAYGKHDVVFVHGVNLAKTLCGGGHFADKLWSIVEDSPGRRLDLDMERVKIETIVAGSRRLVVFDEETRSHIEAVQPAASGKTCVFPTFIRLSSTSYTVPSSLSNEMRPSSAAEVSPHSPISAGSLVHAEDSRASLARILRPGVADYVRIPVRTQATNVLLVGADFKFAGDLIDSLMQRRDVNLRADVWKNNYTPQPEQSTKFIEWADVIICEFSNRNAIWYANNKRPDQTLIVRLHGYELRSPWIDELNFDNVNTMVFVSEFYRQHAIEIKKWKSDKTCVIPNSINISDFDRPKLPDSQFHLGIVGIVPILKRPDRALDLLEHLIEIDDRYTLHVRGHAPWDYNNEWQKAAHQAAYRAFYGRIARSPKLRQRIAFENFGPNMGSWYQKIGWILSPSYRETFHLSPVEGMASRAIPIVWDREGATEVFPNDCIFMNTGKAAEVISNANSDPIMRNQWIEQNDNFVTKYNCTRIGEQWINLISREYHD